MYSDRLDAHITPDQEAIVLLAHALCLSERKRSVWQKTAEMEGERADHNTRKFSETGTPLEGEEAWKARILELEAQLNARPALTREPESEPLQNMRQWARDTNATRAYVGTKTLREMFALIDAPLTLREHVEALVGMGAVEQTWHGVKAFLTDTGVSITEEEERQTVHQTLLLILPAPSLP